MDVDARMQLFDLKTKYQFQTSPAVDQYNMPLYSVQTEPGAQTIGMFPVYQGFTGPAYINGIQVGFQTQKPPFFGNYPNVIQQQAIVATGNGTAGPYILTLPILPSNSVPLNPPINGILRGHVDITGIISTGNNIDPPFTDEAAIAAVPSSLAVIPTTSIYSAVFITSTDAGGNNVIVQDSGQFLTGNANYGILMHPGKAPNGNARLTGAYSTALNTINYLTGACTLNMPAAIPTGVNINAQVYFFQTGLPLSIFYYNNIITLRAPPDRQYLVELDAYLSPAAFLNTAQAIPFGYMAEYLARGAARKMLSDTGDVEQFMFYEPLFREQELLVWKRSQRQWTATRTETIYSQGYGAGSVGGYGFNGAMS